MSRHGDLFPAPPKGALPPGSRVRVTRDLTGTEHDDPAGAAARPGVSYVVEYALPATFDLPARYSLAAVPDDGLAYNAPLDSVRPDLTVVTLTPADVDMLEGCAREGVIYDEAYTP